jgi:hypothetical protein
MTELEVVREMLSKRKKSLKIIGWKKKSKKIVTVKNLKNLV